MHAYDPRVSSLQFHSHTLGVARGLYIYLPPEYQAAPSRRFPAVYLLRGHEREWVNPREDDTRQGTVVDVYEHLRAAGAVGPMILVMPGMSSDDNAVPGMLTDFHSPELAADAPGLGTGQFQRFFFDELMPFVDGRFRTAPAARALVGFSLGGYMAVKAAALHPERFAGVAVFDASIPYVSDSGRAPRPGETLFAPPMFDAPLGRPRHPAHLAANNPITLLLQADANALRRITWVVQYGPEQIEPWGSNFYRGEYLLRALATLGIQNAAPTAALDEARHTWHSADAFAAIALPLLWPALQPHT